MSIVRFKNKKSLTGLKLIGGYSLIELVFYVALFSVLSLVLIDAMITMTKSFRERAIQSELAQSGAIMERMSREIRKAYGINTISTSDLKLDTLDGAGAAKTVEFLFSGSDIQFLENNLFTGNLNTPNITVTALTFTQIITTSGKAVKIALTIRSNNDLLGRTTDFYDTIVLRGVY